jgi:hypothetical protein
MEHWQGQTETQNGKFHERNSKWKISKIQGTGIEMRECQRGTVALIHSCCRKDSIIILTNTGSLLCIVQQPQRSIFFLAQ